MSSYCEECPHCSELFRANKKLKAELETMTRKYESAVIWGEEKSIRLAWVVGERSKLMEERDKLKDDLEEATKWKTSDDGFIHCTDWRINKYIAERDEARQWARRMYARVKEEETIIKYWQHH